MSNAVFRWYDSSEIEPCVVLARMLLISIILVRVVEHLTCMNLVATEAQRPAFVEIDIEVQLCILVAPAQAQTSDRAVRSIPLQHFPLSWPFGSIML